MRQPRRGSSPALARMPPLSVPRSRLPLQAFQRTQPGLGGRPLLAAGCAANYNRCIPGRSGAPSETLMAEQIPFGSDVDLPGEEINPEPRCPCVLLLDVSRSMAGTKIAQLNEALGAYRAELAADTLAAQRVEVAIVTFGGQVETVCPFVTVDR